MITENNSTMRLQLAGCLHQARQDLNVSLVDLARASRQQAHPLSLSFLESMETGLDVENHNYLPTVAELKQLANLYHIKPQALLKLCHYTQFTALKHTATTRVIQQNIPVTSPLMNTANTPDQDTAVVPDQVVKRYGHAKLFALAMGDNSLNKLIPQGFTLIFARTDKAHDHDIVAVTFDQVHILIRQLLTFQNTRQFVTTSTDPKLIQKTADADAEILGRCVFASKAWK